MISGNESYMLCSFSLIPITQSNHEKNIRYMSTEEHSAKYLDSSPQNVRVIRIKENLRNGDSEEELKETH